MTTRDRFAKRRMSTTRLPRTHYAISVPRPPIRATKTLGSTATLSTAIPPSSLLTPLLTTQVTLPAALAGLRIEEGDSTAPKLSDADSLELLQFWMDEQILEHMELRQPSSAVTRAGFLPGDPPLRQ